MLMAYPTVALLSCLCKSHIARAKLPLRHPKLHQYLRGMPITAHWHWISLLAFVALAAAQTSVDPVSQIRAARQRSNRALAMHDAKSFAESLAEDFVIVRGNGIFMPSRQAYIQAIEADFRNPKVVRYERIPDKIEISLVSPIAAEHGHWTATLPNGKRAYNGTYLAMWKRGESGWRIRSELFVLLGCEDEATCATYRK
jgi:uncharacterized protein (TIGR02246 family)